MPRIAVIGLLVALTLNQADGAQAPSAQRLVFDIPSQPLSDALAAFGRQAGLQVLRRETAPAAQDPSSSEVRGDLSVEEALQRLLSSTGLKYEFVDERTVRILTALPTEGRAQQGGEAVPEDRHALRLVRSDRNSRDTADVEESPEVGGVLVTAQKRQESLRDVPISISVLRGEQLDRSTSPGATEILNTLPGVVATTNTQGGGTQIQVRGVAAAAALFAGSSPIAYYLDSAPFGFVNSGIGPNPNVYDLERIEVLRGPQGTLYGASAEGGVVRILTHDPQLDRFELKTRGLVSSSDDGGTNYRGDVAVNLPIVEGRLAARAVIGYQDSSGWIEGTTARNINDSVLRNYRLKVAGKVTDDLSFVASSWVVRDRYGAPNTAGDDGRSTIMFGPMPMITRYDVHSLRVDYQLPGFSIASMTSRLKYGNESELPVLDPATIFTGLYSTVIAEELNLNSRSEGPWTWSAGLFYRDAKDRRVQSLPLFSFGTNYGQTSKSYAAYGELRRYFFDRKFQWLLGLRYFHDDVVNRQNALDINDVTGVLYRERRTFRSTTPRAVLSWRAREDVTLYGSYAEGFRSGFPQDASVAKSYPAIPSEEPDELRNYELGAKVRLLGGRLELDSAMYYVQWDRVQQIIGIPVSPNSLVYTVAYVNGESASGPGFEIAVTARPTDRLDLGVSFGWNDLSLDAPVVSQGRVLFQEGDRLAFSSRYTGSAWAEYSFPLGDGGLEAQLAASANHCSPMDLRGFMGVTPGVRSSDGWTLARASVAVSRADRWSASLFVDNLFNEDGAIAPGPLFTDQRTPRTRPRTVGVQVDYRY